MIYFREIYYRVLYTLTAFFISLYFFFYYENKILNLIFCKLIISPQQSIYYFENLFIINSPENFTQMEITILFFLAIILNTPIFFWNGFYFISSTLKKKKFLKYKKRILFFSFLYIFIFQVVILKIMPQLWLFFEFFCFNLINSSFINIEYEPNFISYLTFFLFLIKTVNFSLYACSFIFLIYFKKVKLNNYLKKKQLTTFFSLTISVIFFLLIISYAPLNLIVKGLPFFFFSFILLFMIKYPLIFKYQTVKFLNKIYEIKKSC